MSRKLKLTPTERDLTIFHFLWRWKFVNTKTLAIKFFDELSPWTAYKRLYRLKKAGFITTQHIKMDRAYVWTLSQKGYNKIEELLPFLENPGFKGENPKHDFLVSSVHIGDWLFGAPEGCDLFCEQQLRRYPIDFYPGWVPRCDYYRPDGYWNIKTPSGNSTIALEVELSQKTNSRYEKVTTFFNFYQKVVGALWIVPNKPSAKRLLATLNEKSQRESSPHQFVLCNDILKANWDSVIYAGSHKGLTISEYLGKNGAKLVQNPSKMFSSKFLVDTRLTVDITKGFKTAPKPKNTD